MYKGLLRLRIEQIVHFQAKNSESGQSQKIVEPLAIFVIPEDEHHRQGRVELVAGDVC